MSFFDGGGDVFRRPFRERGVFVVFGWWLEGRDGKC